MEIYDPSILLSPSYSQDVFRPAFGKKEERMRRWYIDLIYTFFIDEQCMLHPVLGFGNENWTSRGAPLLALLKSGKG